VADKPLFADAAATLRTSAWTGSASPAEAVADARVKVWTLRDQGAAPKVAQTLAVPTQAALWDWADARIGYGVVLADDPQLTPAARASGSDAPEPIRRLIAARQAPVLRWSAALGNEVLLRCDAAGGQRKVSLASSYGIASDCLPRFLLIAAPPTAVPWSLQYALNLRRCVGRLDLAAAELERYVDALLSGFAGSVRDPRAPLIWSVDHGGDDITVLMDRAISRKLDAKFAADADFLRRHAVFGADATAPRLVAELAARRPALVVTTSHGCTGPLEDAAATRATLGVPVDDRHALLDIEALAAAWAPDGAVWYSHACCAAGSDARSMYHGLFDPAGDVMRTLDGVAAACGASIAPLPQRLLGHTKPLAAFIGHVEPTFNWTLRDPRTQQPLSHPVHQALYEHLFDQGGGLPVGHALAQIFGDAATLLGLWAQALRDFNKGLPGAVASALVNQVAALDRLHTVLLGCPTASLPKITAATP